MYAARPARGVLSRCLQQSTPSAPALASTRSFQTSACRMKRKSRFKNVKAEQMGLIQDPKKLENYHKRVFPAYTEAEKTVLRERYTPEQYEAIMAGEDAVDPRDLTIQGRLRDDPFRMEYLEDFATIQPVIDVKPKVQEAPRDVVIPSEKEWVDGFMDRLAERADTKMKDTMGKAVARALRRAKQDNPDMIDYSEEELVELEQNPELRRKIIVGGEAASNKMYAAVEARFAKDPASDKAITPAPWWDQIDKHFFEELSNEFSGEARNPLSATHTDIMKEMRGEPGKTYSALAPELGKVPGVEGMFKPPGDPAEESLDPSGQYKPIQLATGMALRDVLRIATKQVVMRRVAQQTRLGKIIRFHCMVVAGNGNGRLGIGEAKSVDPQIASVTAGLLSLRNMKPIRRYENRTVYGQMEKKFSGTTVKLEARPPGFGLRVSHRIFEMARLAGIHDLAAKVGRSRNPMNTVRATYYMLLNQPDPDQIAIGRGKKLVDVRKVYYGGAV